MTKNDIIVRTKKKLFLNLHGEHLSVLSGNGIDFKEIREYNTNDDIRHINWKRTAQSQRPSVNIFNEDKQLNIVLVYLNSGSLEFTSNKNQKKKKDIATEVLTALSFATIHNNDVLTTIFYTQNEQKFFRPTKNKAIIDTNFDTASNINYLGNSIAYENLSNYLLHKIKKKSIIFLIGDFLDDVNFKILSSIHEIYCVIIRDKDEENLNFNGEYNFINSDTLDSNFLNLDKKSIKTYNDLMEKHDKSLYKHFKSSQINFQKIYTTDDSIDKLNHLTRV